jgi:pyrimidine deaminase RibD-like protein
MRFLEFSKDDYKIHNRDKLDQILVELCHQVIKGKKHDPIKYGMVAACVLDPQNRAVFGVNEAAENNTRRHAERVAMDRYVEQHGEIPEGSIIITTLSPCNEYNTHMADERYGESCTDIINSSNVRKVYCGYQDPSQDNEHNDFTLEQTSNSDVKELCKKFADTFLDNAHKNLSENTAAGITKAFNNLGDPVFANLQRVALLAMQGRQSEAAGRLQTVIKHADPAVQKKITDAVNNIKPVTINGRVADSSTLDKSKQHNDWIINTFIPWVQSLLGQQGVAEGLNESLSSMVDQDQAERNEYANFVKSQAGGDWTKGAKMYAQLKKRPSNDIFGDTVRLNQFMKMKFDFDKFTDEDWDNYWLLAQHCDNNRDFQKNALSIIKKYQGTDHSHYKYLYDRISMGLTGKQKYGTQNVKEQGVAEAVDIGQEWMSDTELDQYVPERLQQQWRELLGYDRNGNPSAYWANLTGGYEPDVNDPQHRRLMVKVANKWFAAKKIPNVKFFDVKDADDELEWLVQIGQQGVAENFADGKNPGRKGLAKRVGVNTKASVSSLRNTAKHSSGEKQRMAHWLANMKAGRAKK